MTKSNKAPVSRPVAYSDVLEGHFETIAKKNKPSKTKPLTVGYIATHVEELREKLNEAHEDYILECFGEEEIGFWQNVHAGRINKRALKAIEKICDTRRVELEIALDAKKAKGKKKKKSPAMKAA